jgi:hypothetical protein
MVSGFKNVWLGFISGFSIFVILKEAPVRKESGYPAAVLPFAGA